MNTVILYTTKHGTAAKCAGILREKASGEIKTVDLAEKPDFDTEPFDKIILGSSVYVGKIQKEMTAFCTKNRQQLLKKKLGLFICCGDHSETGRRYLKLFGEELHTHAVSKKLFGDEIYWEKLNLVEKLIMFIIKKSRTSTSDLETGAISEFVMEMGLH
ncbi:MAG: flavodoxin [Candidatus Sabulitectum sp.]|nr:flavodoxin [Candidatus Sabulitectum sp.]